MSSLYQENQYPATAIADDDTLVAWQSNVLRAVTVDGWINSTAAVTVRLQAANPAVTPTTVATGTTVDTATELGTGWTTLETLAVVANTPTGFKYDLLSRQCRLLVDNASGGSATVALEVNIRD